jgi:hypothetical protein
MYLKASIKLRSPKSMVEIPNKVSSKFNEHFTQIHGAMNRGALSNSSFISSRKTSNEKRGNPKNVKGLNKRPLMKKATPKMLRGSIKDLRFPFLRSLRRGGRTGWQNP